jgi:hypothetical protein
LKLPASRVIIPDYFALRRPKKEHWTGDRATLDHPVTADPDRKHSQGAGHSNEVQERADTQHPGGLGLGLSFGETRLGNGGSFPIRLIRDHWITLKPVDR